MSKLLITVGNGCMGDDGAGALLAQMLNHSTPQGWKVLHGGSAPENALHQIRAYAPTHVVVVDAADMDLPPGSIRQIPEDVLENPLFFTTHTIPLTFFINILREYVQEITFIGIQPEIVAFGYPISSSVTQAVTTLYECIQADPSGWFKQTTTLQ
jgi:hydrogenase 3 maturation protease